MRWSVWKRRIIFTVSENIQKFCWQELTTVKGQRSTPVKQNWWFLQRCSGKTKRMPEPKEEHGGRSKVDGDLHWVSVCLYDGLVFNPLNPRLWNRCVWRLMHVSIRRLFFIQLYTGSIHIPLCHVEYHCKRRNERIHPFCWTLIAGNFQDVWSDEISGFPFHGSKCCVVYFDLKRFETCCG